MTKKGVILGMQPAGYQVGGDVGGGGGVEEAAENACQERFGSTCIRLSETSPAKSTRLRFIHMCQIPLNVCPAFIDFLLPRLDR